ncbi:two-component sensor histidine kinase [Myxococcus stipitatus DSM 14675]|uniref:histidine kinase n=1 Tax=Myxococcus stipitatus (strain DSM 14675 / JCM 12634 / Mx s8) TaxID=1278073 RepID=L7UEJ8_MYXSD|nr:PAS domain-containing sensor histidine kinase [Myxococcus stipitatus]AGC44869.1 two-component sensor histidine kinase [Myxococcus stipitatus DSM 14675]
MTAVRRSGSSHPLDRVLDWLVPAVSLLAILVATTTLLGWATASERAVRIVSIPGAGMMMPNTALALLSMATALWLLSKRPVGRARLLVGWSLASLVLLVGVLVVIEYVGRVDLGIDLLVFRRTVLGMSPTIPGRPSPMTAVNLCLMGASLLLLHVRTRSGWYPARLLAFTVALVSAQALIGYVYLEELSHDPPPGLVAFGPFTAMAVHTALLLLLLALGVLSVHPELGLMGVLRRRDAGGVMARRLLPAAVVAPLLVWGVKLFSERMGLRGAPFSTSIFALITVAVFLGILVRSANALSRMDSRQRQVEQSLRVSEARFSGIVNNAADAILTIDEAKHVTLFNAGAERIFGYSASEALGRPLDVFIQEPRVLLEMPAGRAGEERRRLVGLRKSGEGFPAEATVGDVRVDGMRLQVVILRDISARVRAEEARRNREELFRTAFEHTPIGSSLVALDGHLLMVNSALCSMVGYSREELLARTFQDITHPDDLEMDMGFVRRLLNGELGTYQLEKRYLHKHGHSVDVLLTASLVRDSRGKPLHFISQIQDISERKRLELDLHMLSEAGPRLASSLDPATTLSTVSRLLVPSLSDFCIIAMLDEAGKAMRRECYASTAEKTRLLEALFEAYPQVPFRRGHLLAEVFQTGHSILLNEVPLKLLESSAEDARHLEMMMRLAPMSMIVVPLSARGHTVGVVALGMSESGRRYGARDLALVEEVARRAALAIDNSTLHSQSEQATHLRDEVLRIVAHDLRSPLNVIALSTGTLMKRSPEERASDSRPLVSIQKAVARATALIEDLLDVARMQGGKLKVERRSEATEALLQDALELHRALAEARSIHLQLEVAPGVPAVFVDKDRVLQLFSNLIGNALKFTPMGGLVTLSAEPWGGMVRCSVRDTGSGIPAKDLPHLFEPFWQAGSRSKEGAGLGLTIVKGITDAHGGHVWVESRPGLGTTFYVALPVAKETASAIDWHV